MTPRTSHLLAATALLIGCGDSTTLAPGGADGGTLAGPTSYAFDSRFQAETSSVAYLGQSLRHVLIADLTSYLGDLTTTIDSGHSPADGEVLSALTFYYRFDSTTSGATPVRISTSPAPLQATYGEIQTGADLRGKVAGAETATDHKDWATQFAGWSEGGATTPDALIQGWLEEIDDLAFDRGRGVIATGPDGNPMPKVYLTASGQDLRQLLQKLLLGAVAYSQATDKYLDSATDGKGLRAANARDGGNPFSSLEHAWDEGFGYYGAARDCGSYTDEEVAGAGGRPDYARGYHDTDADGKIDLKSELNFGASTNAAKRDMGSAATARTDFSREAMEAFLRGRAIISSAGDTLTAAQQADLETQRDLAVGNWEKAIAATCVHYINETLLSMNAFGTAAYRFEDHAKVWSELKGFALGLQFNPRKRLIDAQFSQLHALLRDAPVLPTATAPEIGQYELDLLAARALFKDAYGFADANLGDQDGLGGW